MKKVAGVDEVGRGSLVGPVCAAAVIFKKNIELKNIKKNDIIYWKGHVAVALSNKKLIHAYGPMKKTVIMGIDQTIKRIERTAKLKVIGIKRL